MQRARRLYLYFVSAISLIALGTGLARLLTNLFERISDALRGTAIVSGDTEAFRREASLVIAIIVVSLPIWLLHWWLAERATGGDSAQANTERTAPERALYLSGVLFVSFVILLTSSSSFLSVLVRELAGDRLWDNPSALPDSLAMMIMAASIWGYHAHVRQRDERLGAGLAESTVLPRLYLYLATVIAALVMLTGVGHLLGVTAQAIFDAGPFVSDGRWWVSGLADGLGGAVAGLALWSLHMAVGNALVARPDALGDRERRSALRRLALYALTFIGLAVSLFFLSRGLEQVLRALLDASHGSEGFGFRVADPLLRVLPFAGAWYFFGRRVIAEADRAGEATDQATVRRIYSYGIALIGLAAGAGGLAGTLAALFHRLAGETRPIFEGIDPWKDDLSRMLPIAMFGTAAWLWQSYRVGRWVESNPDVERTNIVRRVYVYVSLAGSVVAVLVSLALIIYKVLTAILNVGTESLGRELSTPGGVFLVAAAVLTYHALLLRSDLAARPEAVEESRRLLLEITLPPGIDLDEIANQVAQGLPEGSRVRLLTPTKSEAAPEPPLSDGEQGVSHAG